ncbi:MAG: hypothetical protein IPM82_28720 [Saprospiraceae bacterium]|nr:hypothetical protein [Saprospiraceae bacterium]
MFGTNAVSVDYRRSLDNLSSDAITVVLYHNAFITDVAGMGVFVFTCATVLQIVTPSGQATPCTDVPGPDKVLLQPASSNLNVRAAAPLLCYNNQAWTGAITSQWQVKLAQR